MTKIESCDCGTPFVLHTLDHPDCSVAKLNRQINSSTSQEPHSEARESVKVNQNKSNLEMSSLIQAQNRTTHAVRSLAITFVAAPIISLIVILACAAAITTGNTVLMLISSIGGLVVLLMILVKSLTELSKSGLNL